MSDEILSRQPPPADKRLAYGSDPYQFVDLRLPHKGKTDGLPPLVINIHGGFWRAKYNLDHAAHLCAALTASGPATANLEYRRVGNPGGGWPGTFADIRSAYQFLLQRAQAEHFDREKIVVMGHSAGGQLALCLAAHEPTISRVISLAGVVDLQQAYKLHLSNDAVVEFLHGTPNEVPEHYQEADPMRLCIPHVRQVLIQGTVDDTVPVAFSRDYVREKGKRSPRENASLVEIAGAGHIDLIDPGSAAWKQVQAAVMRLVA
ncbi:MAG TPA: alpha/beta hydrolase [Candidatus Binatia bacterium]|nr:alpha/beta hydrolase [Candidatus Binatia bacterium]